MIRIRRVSADAGGLAADTRALPSEAAARAAASAEIIRDFDDPYLELVRLLREAAEIEHALMVQYLYGAYSLKPAYARGPRLLGDPKPQPPVGRRDPGDATPGEEVNRMLGELGERAPNLVRQGFPDESGHLPIPAQPRAAVAGVTLAKYVYTEAPAHKLDRDNPDNADPATQAFLDRLDAALGGVRAQPRRQPLQGAIIDRTNEVIAAALPGLPDLSGMARPHAGGHQGRGRKRPGALRLLPQRLPRHPTAGFGGHPDPWGPPARPPRLPRRWNLGTNPSALDGNPNTDPDRRRTPTPRLAQRPALLDHPRAARPRLPLGLPAGASARAKRHMTSALGPLGAHLATLGVGLPFDPLSAGYALGRDTPTTARLLRALVARGTKVVTGRRSMTSCPTASTPPRSTPTPWPRSTR